MNSIGPMSRITRFRAFARWIAPAAACLAFVAAGGAAHAQGDAGVAEPHDAAAQTPASRVTIVRVLPNPASGPERVELVNEGPIYRAYLPTLMVDSGAPTWSVGEPPVPPAPGEPSADVGEPPVPQDPSAAPNLSLLPAPPPLADLRGWQLGSDVAGWYAFSADLPPIPKGTRVVVVFDGAGDAANDVDLADGVIELHTPPGLVDVLDDANGQIALHSSPARSAHTLRSTMAWAVAAQ